MKTAVEIAKQVLGPKHVSQQIDAQWRTPLETMAKAVLVADEHCQKVQSDHEALKAEHEKLKSDHEALKAKHSVFTVIPIAY